MSNAHPVTVLGISGSLRKGSFNTALLRAAADLAPDDVTIVPFDLSGIPFYNDDVRAAGIPSEVAAFRAALATADAVLFATPEYNRSIPGVLKNAIDWASRGPDQPFDDKPVAIMGASRSALGTALANHHLRQVLVFLNAMPLNGPEVLIGDAAAKFDAEGTLTDEASRDFVRKHLERLAKLIRRR